MITTMGNTGAVKRFFSIFAPMAALEGIAAFLFFDLDARHERAMLYAVLLILLLFVSLYITALAEKRKKAERELLRMPGSSSARTRH